MSELSAKKSPVSPSTPSQQAFHDYMLSHWAPAVPLASTPIEASAVYRRRRTGLAKHFPNQLLVIPSGHERTRANDTCFRFRPGSDFMYLTGCQLPDAVLVLDVDAHGVAAVKLFVEPGTGRQDTRFFLDRHRGELWIGPQPTVQDCQTLYGISDVLPLNQLPTIIQQAIEQSKSACMVRNVSAPVDQLLPSHRDHDQALAQAIATMRLYKDKQELVWLKQACQATRQAFDAVVRTLPHMRSERDVEVIFASEARRLGNDIGYNVIAAAGAHACILHWHHNNGPLAGQDLLLLDAGVEMPSLYTADVTRTLPISGKFNAEQRDVYAIVLAAQEAGIAAARLGASFLAPHEAASRVLAQGLLDLGVCQGSLAEILDPALPKFRRYTLHGTSHMLGLDVHDCAHAPEHLYRQGKFAAGHVFTVEPGLYFQPNDETVPAALRGIGVRIEDDVAIDATGTHVLSDVPKQVAEVEAWMEQGQAYAQQLTRALT